MTGSGRAKDLLWYKDAIIYELPVSRDRRWKESRDEWSIGARAKARGHGPLARHVP